MEGKTEKLIMNEATNNPADQEYIKKVREYLKNPYDWLYYWVRGEIHDIKALKAAIDQKDLIEKNLAKMAKKLENAGVDLNTLKEGKTTLRTVFKTLSDSDQYKKEIETLGRDIESNEILLECVNIHLGNDIIPQFKKSKMRMYRQIL